MENRINRKESQSNDLMGNLIISKASFLSSKLIIGLIIFIILGVGTGYIFGKKNSFSTPIASNSVGVSSGDGAVGSLDTKTFKDAAEGKLELGGINGEGAYHLVRQGGKSQYVYLTSSVVDLTQFVGKKVKVWGETQKAQYAGWLMDVGRVEKLD